MGYKFIRKSVYKVKIIYYKQHILLGIYYWKYFCQQIKSFCFIQNKIFEVVIPSRIEKVNQIKYFWICECWKFILEKSWSVFFEFWIINTKNRQVKDIQQNILNESARGKLRYRSAFADTVEKIVIAEIFKNFFYNNRLADTFCSAQRKNLFIFWENSAGQNAYSITLVIKPRLVFQRIVVCGFAIVAKTVITFSAFYCCRKVYAFAFGADF